MINVMIVDDHPQHVQSLVEKVNSILGFIVIGTAKDGIEVLDYIRHKKVLPDIILLDVEMPLYDGVSTMDFTNDFHTEIKVIGISSHFEKPVVDSMMACGALGFLNKPNIVTTQRLPYNATLDIGGLAKTALRDALEAVINNHAFVDLRLRYDIRKREKLMDERIKKKQKFYTQYNITNREKELIALAHPQIKNSIIATLLNISDRTIENQYAQLAKKFDVPNGKVGVTTFCYRWGVNKYAQL
jgi:DNA-binding NarL/FixJ family response regulator